MSELTQKRKKYLEMEFLPPSRLNNATESQKNLMTFPTFAAKSVFCRTRITRFIPFSGAEGGYSLIYFLKKLVALKFRCRGKPRQGQLLILQNFLKVP